MITLLSWPLVELGAWRFLVVVQKHSLVLAILSCHLASFELDEKLLYVLLSFLLRFTVPWVQLLAKSQLLGLLELFFFELLLECLLL